MSPLTQSAIGAQGNNQLDDGGADHHGRDQGEQSGDLALTCINETEETSLGTRGFTHGLQSLKGL